MFDRDAAWRAVLAIRHRVRAGAAPGWPLGHRDGGTRILVEAGGAWRGDGAIAPEAAQLLDLYLPYAVIRGGAGHVAAHLGQSLDGRIATSAGASRWVTGAEDIEHNHRMRALADAVLVGAATLRHDDPQLTVRSCEGENPVRVVLDMRRSLGPQHRVFQDGAAPTLVLVAEGRARPGERLGAAEIVPLPGAGEGIAPALIRTRLAARGLTRLFVEGGGVTVSRFLAARCLDRLQITISPLIIGSGRPSIVLPEIADPQQGLRPQVRRFILGEDVMFEARFETAGGGGAGGGG